MVDEHYALTKGSPLRMISEQAYKSLQLEHIAVPCLGHGHLLCIPMLHYYL